MFGGRYRGLWPSTLSLNVIPEEAQCGESETRDSHTILQEDGKWRRERLEEELFCPFSLPCPSHLPRLFPELLKAFRFSEFHERIFRWFLAKARIFG